MGKSLFFEKHIMKQFDDELDGIRNGMLKMSGKVEQQLQRSVKSLVESDSELAKEVIENEMQVDEMELQIDASCLMVLAKHQPAARDLRLVVAITRAVKDLERIGDEAHNIARHGIIMSEIGFPARGQSEVEELSGTVMNILHQALDAFARFDEETALLILKDSSGVSEYQAALGSLSEHMQDYPETINQLINILWVIHSLERVHQHAMNLCEQVVFLVQGKDIRHN